MIGRRAILLAVLALTFPVSIALADKEPLGAHTQHTPKTVVLDNERILPPNLEMSTNDALVFENHSVHPIRVTFTEPADLPQKIRCGLIRKSDEEKAQAPWQLFTWTDGKLGATIPPGRFASVCSLQEGSYAYTTSPIGVAVRSTETGGRLPEKGQISVK
jgi:hypothetical protein